MLNGFISSRPCVLPGGTLWDRNSETRFKDLLIELTTTDFSSIFSKKGVVGKSCFLGRRKPASSNIYIDLAFPRDSMFVPNAIDGEINWN